MGITSKIQRGGNQARESIRHVEHASFQDRKSALEYSRDVDAPLDDHEFGNSYMPDDVTRATTKKMHYAAYRAEKARKASDSELWRGRYFRLRDRIVLGNRKLIFGAVKKKVYQNASSDDLIGECYIVMIKVVAAYNPWLGIRFSTYAYTCLMRALSRLNQRSLSDRFAHHLSLDNVLDKEPVDRDPDAAFGGTPKIEDYLQKEHPLLSAREKVVLRRRYHLSGCEEDATLDKVGRDLGISKERVRQVQAGAISKLRVALAPEVVA